MPHEKDVNEVNLLGTLGRDPELRTLANGNPIATLSVATSERWKDKKTGDWKQKTEWHRVVTFDVNMAELASRLSKGDRVRITGGKLQTRKWTNKDGVDQYSTEILVGFGGKIEQPTPAVQEPERGAPAFDDEIPF